MGKDYNEMNDQQSAPNQDDMTNGQNDAQGNQSDHSTYFYNGYNHTYQENGNYQNGDYNNGNYNNGNFNNGYGPYGNGPYGQDPNNQPPKKSSNKLLKLCGVAALGLVVGLGAYASLRVADRRGFFPDTTLGANNNVTAPIEEEKDDTTSPVKSDPIKSTETVDGANTNSGVSSVVESALPSIVMINCNVSTTRYGQQAQGVASGSGIIIKEDDKYLYVATNYHVVSEAQSISVVFNDEKSVNATLKAYDSTNDLAILKIKLRDIKDSTKKSIKIATLGSSDDLKVGAMAIAIGNALGYGQSVTVGYVSAKDRPVTMDNSTRVLLQTDAAINPGNSGGALLDITGKVIGINSAKYSSTDVEGVCYAIPISKAIPILNDLMTKDALSEEEKGYLGISGTDVDETVHAYYNIPLGVRVTEVANKGAADLAGIKENDIITGVNGIEVTSISALKERVNSYKVGTEVTITLQRQSNGGYKEMKVKVKLQKGTAANNSQGSQSQQGSQGNRGDDGGNYYYFGGNGNSDGNGSQWPFSIR